MKTIIKFSISVVILVLIAYGLLYFFGLDTGALIDWVVGLASFLWLMVIVTVPWNANFKAKEVLDDAEISKRKEILVIDKSLLYAKKVARWSLIIAISLHLASAIILFLIANMQITPVGYFGSAAAVLLAFLRPSVRFYEYLQLRLGNIQKEFRYPREDVRELLNKFDDFKLRIKNMEFTLSSEEKVDSWRNNLDKSISEQQEKLTEFYTLLSKLEFKTEEEFKVVRQEAFVQLDKITTDSKVLDSVREIAGFIRQLKMG